MTEAVHLKDYPFLSEIPNYILSTVDLNVLRQLSHEESLLVQALALRIGKNIVVYKKHFKPTSGHLCKQIVFADLSELELRHLQSVEKAIGENAVVVAYEKPIQLVNSSKG